MRILKPLLPILLILLLSGCSTSRQVENQAYVLTMGLDKTDSGLNITIQIPKIASSGEQESAAAGGSGGSYFKFSAEGRDFEDTLQKLDWVVPRSLNLSHLKLIVLSEDLAGDAGFRDLLGQIVHTERLFSAARVAVCRDKASEFIEKLKPVVGSRLSTDILSTFDYYINLGFVPDSNLAELYYATESVYSDPMTACALLTNQAEAAPASVLGSGIAGVPETTSSEISAHYLGAAVFSEGVCAGFFNASETIFANLLKGSLKTMQYRHDGQGIQIFHGGKPRYEINLDNYPIQIKAKLRLNIGAQEEVPDLEGLRQRLETQLRTVIEKAQQLKAEPFGIAEAAAGKFSTLDAWSSYNWMEKFSQADVSVEVSLRRTGT